MTTDSPDERDDAHIMAVQRLFIQYQPAIRGYILAMIPDFSLAEDVMQEIFLVVTRKAAAFELGTSFPAWVKTIARYKCLETIRARRNQADSLSEEVLESLDAERQGFFASQDERLIHLSACIGLLAPQAYKSIKYRYHDEHLPPEIAKLMGCTVQSVNVTLSRARTFLRECVSRKLPTNPS